MDWKDLMAPLGVVFGAVFVGLGRALNVGRNTKGNDKLARKHREDDEANRERISELYTKVGVLESQVRESQKQIDEIFVRMRNIEASVNQLIGFLKDRL